MGVSKQCLFLIFFWLKVTETETSGWTAQVTNSVKGVPGSCVVIPCSYNYPDPERTSKFTGIWFGPKDVTIFHSEDSKIHQDYRKRTKLVGEIKEKNCSLMIDPLRESDTGPFYFRIEIDNYDRYSYQGNKASISFIKPDDISLTVAEDHQENRPASASCSLSYFCPIHPPDFKWSHSGKMDHHSQKLDEGRWSITSVLTFRPNQSDHNKPLWCNVTYRGGHQQSTFKTLKVKYAPVVAEIEHEPHVREGESVGLSCSGDANPPVSEYEWRNETGALVYLGNYYKIQNVSRNIGTLYCTAINEVGRATSKPVKLNVLYAPDIKIDSSCSSKENLVNCVCKVESKPPSTVSFVLADKVLQGTKEDKSGFFTISVLQEDFESHTFLECVANNTLGKANLRLSLPLDGKRMLFFIAAGAGGILVIILIVVGVFVKCRRSTDTEAPGMSTIMSERNLELPQCARSKWNSAYEDSSYDAIYANADVHKNMADNDDGIYANM
ncbi:unnamed protein product [Menidia menidia]|uniref:(Atlantic silverside) hypothetical protein n=1 Tax=Menidia menidia TaxID=238744 RepID=A0A8S4BUU3_9TELE|nr:unnamed protein product [Menidia menidia]